MSEDKKDIITALLQEYDIHSAEDIQDTIKDLLEETYRKCLRFKFENTKKISFCCKLELQKTKLFVYRVFHPKSMYVDQLKLS